MTRVTEQPADILIVDDVAANVRVLADMVKSEGYRARTALSGELALVAAESQAPDLVLLDVMMPGIDGYEVCRRMKANPALTHVPIIFLSARDSADDKVEAFAAGGVDYITKPFQIDEVHARLNTHLRLRRLQVEVEEYSRELETLVNEQVREIADSQMATIFALAKLAESRDDETGTHLERVREFCRMLTEGMAERRPDLGIDAASVHNIVLASTLHDIGKVAIRDDVLLKPGALTSEEFEVMKTHTVLGSQTLAAVHDQYPNNGFLAVGIDISRSHHEHWDGRGYPDGLAGEDIPLCARIMAVADVYDAMRSKRVYKDALTHEQAVEEIVGHAGTHFDPDAAAVFESLAEEFRAIFER